MKEKTFEEHAADIIKFLNLDNSLSIFVGDWATKYAENNDEIYLREHKKALKASFKGVNGLYLWWENENTVLLTEKNIGTLAHELRHAWQYKNREQEGFNFKKPSGKIGRIIEKINYCGSRKEIDANMYARCYCKMAGMEKEARDYCKAIRFHWLMRICKSMLLIPLIILFVVVIQFFKVYLTV